MRPSHFLMDSEAIEAEERKLQRLDELADDCRLELRRVQMAGGDVKPANLEPENRAMYARRSDAISPLKDPNAWAIKRLAELFCDASHYADARRWRVDAGEARLFAQMLQHVVSQAIPTLYIREQARTLFPVDMSIPSGAETVLTQRVVDHDDQDPNFGMLSPAGDDISIVDVEGDFDTYRLLTYAKGCYWSLDELEAAAFAGVNLRTERLAAVNRAAERVFDQIAFQGHAAGGLVGWYNDANVAVTVLTTGTWAAATADQIVADVHDLMQAVNTASGFNAMPRRLVVPANREEFLALRRANTDNNVRSMLLQDFPGLSIAICDRANAYDVAGTGPRLLAFTPDPMYGTTAVARSFTLEAPEQHGARFRLWGRQKLGGAQIKVPLTVGYADGT